MLKRTAVGTALLTAALVTATALSAPASTAHYRNYVALGDSYTAGPFIPLQRLDPLGCLRSTRNYPALLASTLDVDSYTDVSCSGADTTNMTQPQSVILGTNPPQFNALKTDTDLVSLGIGGNDHSVFGTIISTCSALRTTDPHGNPCQRHFTVDGKDTLAAQIADTQQRVESTVAGIHQRSPHAKIIVVGYPKIAPDEGYCPSRLPLADGDYRWADQIERTLDTALEQASLTTEQAQYVDTYTASIGHDICAPSGVAWINGKAFRPLSAAPFHPFENAMVAEAGLISRELGNQSPISRVGVSGKATATTEQLRLLRTQVSIH